MYICHFKLNCHWNVMFTQIVYLFTSIARISAIAIRTSWACTRLRFPKALSNVYVCTNKEKHTAGSLFITCRETVSKVYTLDWAAETPASWMLIKNEKKTKIKIKTKNKVQIRQQQQLLGTLSQFTSFTSPKLLWLHLQHTFITSPLLSSWSNLSARRPLSPNAFNFHGWLLRRLVANLMNHGRLPSAKWNGKAFAKFENFVCCLGQAHAQHTHTRAWFRKHAFTHIPP